MYLSVKISGRPIRKGGFIPIVNVNDAHFSIADIYTTSVSTDKVFYTFAVGADMSVYKLVFTRISTPGVTFASPLVVAVSIPQGWSLPEGVTVKEVLDRLLEAFLDKFAMAKGEGYVYDIHSIDTAGIEGIVAEYPLQPDESQRRVMDINGPKAALVVKADEIADYLQRTSNDVFTPYSEIFVGEHINDAVIRQQVPVASVIYNEESSQMQAAVDYLNNLAEESADDMAPTADDIDGDTAEYDASDAYSGNESPESGTAPYILESVGPTDDPYIEENAVKESTADTSSSSKRNSMKLILPLLVLCITLGALIADILMRYHQSEQNMATQTEQTETAPDTIIKQDTVKMVDTVTVVKTVTVTVPDRSNYVAPVRNTNAPQGTSRNTPVFVDDNAPAPEKKSNLNPNTERALPSR